MRRSRVILVLVASGAILAVGLAAIAWTLGAGSSEAQEGAMQNCPRASKWAIAVWSGDDGTDAGQALATCGEGAVNVAYYIDPDAQGWLRWFAGQPELSNLDTLNDMQGVIALGAVGAPAATPTPVVPTPSPSPSPAPGAGLTRDNPVPFGQTLTVPPGWDIRILNVDWDAWPEHQAENMFNEPPEEGYRMVMVTIRAHNVQPGDQPAWISDGDFEMVGSRNIVYRTYERSCGVTPDELWAEVFPGGTVEGNACFQAGIDETNLLLSAALTWSNEDRRYFALQ